MASAAKSKGSKAAVWTILVLLIVGLAGFGTTNFSGTVDSIGTVGNRNIDLQRYARALQDQLRAYSTQTGADVSIADALELGIDQAVLERLTAAVALEDEAERIGLSAGDDPVRREILRMPAFQGLDGNFDKEAYSFVLERAGLDEKRFEDDLRSEIARNIVQDAVGGGMPIPEIYIDTVLAYIGEQRSFALATLDSDRLETKISDPSDADLRGYFDQQPDEFMLPETREITYAWLIPEMLIDTIEIDEDALMALYEENIDEYVLPERRLVERLVLGDEAAEAKSRLDAGDVSFDELVAERNLGLGDIDLGDVSEADLGAAGAVVFASEGLGVVGPADTAFGPALFRVNGILSARNTTFDEARAELVDEFALDRARRVIADRIEDFDDLLAGGATLEELTSETELRLDRINWTDDSSDGISAYTEFRLAAHSMAEGDFPEIAELEDGGVFALRIDSILEPRLPEFQDVKEDVQTAWRANATADALETQAQALVERLKAGTAPEDLGIAMRVETDIRRDGYIADVPIGLRDMVFEMSVGDISVHKDEAAAYIVRLDDISPPDPEDAASARQREFIERFARQELSAEALLAYSREVEAKAGVSLDRAALNAVHAQFP